MASIQELIQLAQFQQQNQPGQGLPNALNNGLQSFMGGMEQAKQEDDVLLDRTLKFFEIQKKMAEYQDYMSRVEQAKAQQRGQAFSGVTSDATDKTNSGKTTNALQDLFQKKNTPNGRWINSLVQASGTYQVPKAEFKQWGSSGPEFTATDPQQGLLDELDVQQKKATLAKTLKETSAVGDNGIDTKAATDLRKEFQGLSTIKNFTDMSRSYSIMTAAYKEALSKKSNESKAAADQALVTTFNKMLDPGSVVRESEYARTGEGQSAMAQLQGFIERVRQGGVGLTDENRKSVVDISKKLMQEAQKVYQSKREEYTAYAKDYKTDPRLVVGKDYSMSFDDESQFQLGETKIIGDKTYKFIGADKWEEQ